MTTAERSIDAVAFDFGGVLIHALIPTMQTLAARHGVDLATILDVLMGPMSHDSDHPWHRAERGELALDEVQAELPPYAAAHGIELHGDEIDVVMAPSDYLVNVAVVDHIVRLRSQGYRTALVTNSFREFRSKLEEIVDLPTLFDVVVDSSEVGARKPSPRLFALLLERLGVSEPDRVVFLDDFAGNIEGARSAGLRTIHVTDVEAALAALDELLDEGAAA